MTATMNRKRHVQLDGLTPAQIGARLGVESSVVREALQSIGMSSHRTYGVDVIPQLRRAIRDIPQVEIDPDRVCVGKYRCIKCAAFCGLVWSDGTMPDAPNCDDEKCPAVADLGPPTYLEL